jgi:hypothetical protein
VKQVSTEDKKVELVKELIRATEEGRIVWRPTAKLDEFTTSLQGRFSILVWREENGACHLKMMDEDDRELLRISEQDQVFWRSEPPSPEAVLGKLPPIYLLPQLFDLARRGGLRVDQTLDQILQGLKST